VGIGGDWAFHGVSMTILKVFQAVYNSVFALFQEDAVGAQF
jgi:hypothetical protein